MQPDDPRLLLSTSYGSAVENMEAPGHGMAISCIGGRPNPDICEMVNEVVMMVVVVVAAVVALVVGWVAVGGGGWTG